MADRSRLRSGRRRPLAGKGERVLDARPDTLDFRDQMFIPTLVEVPVRINLHEYRSAQTPVLDQGSEGACTGFGLATVANYLLRRRKVEPDLDVVSARMFYEMARRYDEWPGERYQGSSARGAMKGWHKHGVCSATIWPYIEKDRDLALFEKRWQDAVRRPLGAYFRVNHKDIVAMHAAIAEVGVLYATANVHAGWDDVDSDGIIRYPNDKMLGGHAFAIVAYGERGFWIQNSWGPDWGKDGFGLVCYDDWLNNGTDVWVARLGAPIALLSAESSATGTTASAKGTRSYVFCDLRPHIISIGNDGRFRTTGTYGTSVKDAEAIIGSDFPRLTSKWPGTKHLLLYAHGGLVPEDASVQRVADYRAALLQAQVYPLAFVWKTDYWSTLRNILQDALGKRRPEGVLDAAKDFMLDRLDDALEPIARVATGKTQWDEMKENGLLATTSHAGAARAVAGYVAALMAKDPSIRLHVAGHSAGSILLAPLVRRLTAAKRDDGLGLLVSTCTLWAPACTIDLFREYYLPAIRAKRVQQFGLFTLTDEAEKNDHCANIYHKSLLYLVSDAFERQLRLPWQADGEPLLGMAKFVAQQLTDVTSLGHVDWVRAPNAEPLGSPHASGSTSHGGFDDDAATLQATLARILKTKNTAEHGFEIHRSGAGQRATRRRLELAS